LLTRSINHPAAAIQKTTITNTPRFCILSDTIPNATVEIPAQAYIGIVKAWVSNVENPNVFRMTGKKVLKEARLTFAQL
jgi:hypothetical protein